MSAGGTPPLRSGWAFVRFALVGGLCFLSGMLLVYGLTDGLGWHYLLSTASAMLAANAMGWLLNRSWTYRSRRRRSTTEFLRYALVNVAGMAASLLMVDVLVSRLQLHYVLACVLVAIAMALVNFQLHGRYSLRLERDAGA